ncbi:hypothetical protein BT63DRAFT_299308 [Microthyrium microscopicum]|uniref:Homeobox domain-containing protein n=1 Tax=Microthyrium microscopicum TaxID=703497 RepID=A0A6A6U612_9PEZI|nr:hypothetical protein BT63DRAFT_299308 [Microthyrium microscopicum]
MRMAVPVEKINNWFQNRRAKSRQDEKKTQAAIERGDPPPPSTDEIPLEEATNTSDSGSASQPAVSESSSTPTQSSLPHEASPKQEHDPSMPTSAPDMSEFLPHFTNYPPMQRYALPSQFSAQDHFMHHLQMPVSAMESTSDHTLFSVESLANVAQYPQEPRNDTPPLSSGSQSPHPFADSFDILGSYVAPRPTTTYVSTEPTIAASECDYYHHPPLPETCFSDFGSLEYSVASTPTMASFADHHSSPASVLSTTRSTMPSVTTTDFSVQPISDPSFLSPQQSNDLKYNTSSVSLPNLADSEKMEMPPPENNLFIGKSRTPLTSIADRRRKAAPAALGLGSKNPMGRNNSYTAGMPLSPRSPFLGTPEQALRRIKSSQNNACRIQKPSTPAQRSPAVAAFAQNLFDSQTPPPSAPLTQTMIPNITYPASQQVILVPSYSNIQWAQPYSAPPTQQTFGFNTPGFQHSPRLPNDPGSTPSPTSTGHFP